MGITHVKLNNKSIIKHRESCAKNLARLQPKIVQSDYPISIIKVNTGYGSINYKAGLIKCHSWHETVAYVSDSMLSGEGVGWEFLINDARGNSSKVEVNNVCDIVFYPD